MLVSKEFTLARAKDLVAPQINIPDTLTQQLLDLDPTEAFAPNVLNDFRNVFLEEITRYLNLELDIFSDYTDLISNINLLDNNELSAALYNFGFNPTDFVDISADNIDIDFVDRVFNGVTCYRNTLNGGPDFIVNNLRTIEDITTKSLNDLDIRSAVDSFIGPVTSSVESIIQRANVSIRQLTDEVLNTATAEAEAILDSVIDLPIINESVIREAKNQARDLFNDIIGGQLNDIQAGLPSRIAFIPTLTQQMNQVLEPETTSHLKNIKATSETFVENVYIPDIIGQDSQVLVNKMMTVVEQLVTVAENARVEVVSSSIAKEFMDGNPEADIREIENIISTQITEANNNRELIITRVKDRVQTVVRAFEPIINDLKTAADDVATDSVIAGRPIPLTEEVIKNAPIVLSTLNTFEKSYFYPSNYRTKNSQKINTLFVKVRARFAAAIKEFIDIYFEDGYDMSITSAFRSYTKQAELYRQYRAGELNTQAAAPGNSWHNYGCAADVGIWYNGVYKSKQSYPQLYTQLAAPIFAKYDLHNPHSNDEFHFQPTELALSARTVKDTLVVDNKVDFNLVSSLVA